MTLDLTGVPPTQEEVKTFVDERVLTHTRRSSTGSSLRSGMPKWRRCGGWTPYAMRIPRASMEIIHGLHGHIVIMFCNRS